MSRADSPPAPADPLRKSGRDGLPPHGKPGLLAISKAYHCVHLSSLSSASAILFRPPTIAPVCGGHDYRQAYNSFENRCESLMRSSATSRTAALLVVLVVSPNRTPNSLINPDAPPSPNSGASVPPRANRARRPLPRTSRSFAASIRAFSAATGHHFARPGNRFGRPSSGIPRQLSPAEERELAARRQDHQHRPPFHRDGSELTRRTPCRRRRR